MECWEKDKKHWVGLIVGLQVVHLRYGLYIVYHLSNWFTIFKF